MRKERSMQTSCIHISSLSLNRSLSFSLNLPSSSQQPPRVFEVLFRLTQPLALLIKLWSSSFLAKPLVFIIDWRVDGQTFGVGGEWGGSFSLPPSFLSVLLFQNIWRCPHYETITEPRERSSWVGTSEIFFLSWLLAFCSYLSPWEQVYGRDSLNACVKCWNKRGFLHLPWRLVPEWKDPGPEKKSSASFAKHILIRIDQISPIVSRGRILGELLQVFETLQSLVWRDRRSRPIVKLWLMMGDEYPLEMGGGELGGDEKRVGLSTPCPVLA